MKTLKLSKAVFLLSFFLIGLYSQAEHEHYSQKEKQNIETAITRTKSRPEPSFLINQLKDPESIISSLDQGNCEKYENNMHLSVLGEKSWLKPFSNCAAYNIDKGLAPLCKIEQETKEISDIDGLEEYLDLVISKKSYMINNISEIVTRMVTVCDDMDYFVHQTYLTYKDYYSSNSQAITQDGLSYSVSNREDRLTDKTLSLLKYITRDTVIRKECQSVYESLDFKIRKACKELTVLDFL